MKAIEIRAAIARAGTSQTAIAEYLGVTPASVSRVVNGTMRSQRIEAELAKVVGHPLFAPAGRPGRKKTVWTGQVSAVAA